MLVTATALVGLKDVHWWNFRKRSS